MSAIYPYLKEKLSDRSSIELRLISTKISDQLVTELDFNTQRIAAPQLVILSGNDEQGKLLVCDAF